MTRAVPPDVAVIIVNYGTAALTVDAVESVLARGHGGRTVAVHVVDNASPKKDAAILQAAHDERGWGQDVTLHLETVNHGFGRGNNLVLESLAQRLTLPDKIFLLNPDARLDNETIAVLADFLEAHPQAGAAGARIERPGSGIVTSAFRFPCLSSEFSEALGFGPVARLLASRSVWLRPDLPSGPVDWVAGAAVMLRGRTLQELGGFDPDFFLYFEEVELMHRLRAAGWEVWHVAEARIVHHEGAATGLRSADSTRPPRPDYWYDSLHLYFLKTRGRAGAMLAALLRFSGWSLNRLIARMRGRQSSAPPGFADGMWRRVLRPLLRLEPRPARR